MAALSDDVLVGVEVRALCGRADAAGRDVFLQPVVLDRLADEGGVRPFPLRDP